QLTRLSACSIRMGFAYGDQAMTVNTRIVSGFELWADKSENQRTLWPSQVQLSLDYFEDLIQHGVALDGYAIAALSHSSLALDVYAWLASRLHRVKPGKPMPVSWP